MVYIVNAWEVINLASLSCIVGCYSIILPRRLAIGKRTRALNELNRTVGTTPVISILWRLMHYHVKISGARGSKPMTYVSASECAIHYTTAPHCWRLHGVRSVRRRVRSGIKHIDLGCYLQLWIFILCRTSSSVLLDTMNRSSCSDLDVRLDLVVLTAQRIVRTFRRWNCIPVRHWIPEWRHIDLRCSTWIGDLP